MITIVQLIKKELFFKKHYALTCNVRRLLQVSTLSRSTVLGVTNIREQKARVSRRERKDMFDYKRQCEVSFGFLTKGLKDQGTTIDVSAISAHRKPRSFGVDVWDAWRNVPFPPSLPVQVFVIEVFWRMRFRVTSATRIPRLAGQHVLATKASAHHEDRQRDR